MPQDVVEQWIKFLRNEFPTVAFKASTQVRAFFLTEKPFIPTRNAVRTSTETQHK